MYGVLSFSCLAWSCLPAPASRAAQPGRVSTVNINIIYKYINIISSLNDRWPTGWTGRTSTGLPKRRQMVWELWGEGSITDMMIDDDGSISLLCLLVLVSPPLPSWSSSPLPSWSSYETWWLQAQGLRRAEIANLQVSHPLISLHMTIFSKMRDFVWCF